MSKKSKNKMKAWRRMSKKYRAEDGTIVRPGRQLKMFTVGYEGKKQATGLLAALIKRLPDVTVRLSDYVKRVNINETK
jgi:hypothetical protein